MIIIINSKSLLGFILFLRYDIWTLCDKERLKNPYKVWYFGKPRPSNPLPPGLAFSRRTFLSLVNIFIFTRYSDIFHSTYNVCTVFWKSDSDKIFYPLWRQRCISKLLQWAARAFSAFCKRPILKYREIVGEMLTQRSGRENTSSLLDVPKSCRCDPGHGQVSMITDNPSYHHFIFSKAAVTAGAKLKPSKFSYQNFMLTFLFFSDKFLIVPHLDDDHLYQHHQHLICCLDSFFWLKEWG